MALHLIHLKEKKRVVKLPDYVIQVSDGINRPDRIDGPNNKQRRRAAVDVCEAGESTNGAADLNCTPGKKFA